MQINPQSQIGKFLLLAHGAWLLPPRPCRAVATRTFLCRGCTCQLYSLSRLAHPLTHSPLGNTGSTWNAQRRGTQDAGHREALASGSTHPHLSPDLCSSVRYDCGAAGGILRTAMASHGPGSRPGHTSVTAQGGSLPSQDGQTSLPAIILRPRDAQLVAAKHGDRSCNPRGPYNCTWGMGDPGHYTVPIRPSLPPPLSRPSRAKQLSLHEAVDWQSRQALRPALLCSSAWSWLALEQFVSTLAPCQPVRKTPDTQSEHAACIPASAYHHNANKRKPIRGRPTDS